MTTNCIFCKIVSGSIPSRIVYKDESVTAFHDVNPQAPVHILVVPNQHIGGVLEVTENEAQLAARCLLVANQIARSEGFDANDRPGKLREPDEEEISHSVAATIYAVWRNQFLRNTLAATLARVEQGLPLPTSFRDRLGAARNLIDSFDEQQGVGAQPVLADDDHVARQAGRASAYGGAPSDGDSDGASAGCGAGEQGHATRRYQRLPRHPRAQRRPLRLSEARVGRRRLCRRSPSRGARDPLRVPIKDRTRWRRLCRRSPSRGARDPFRVSLRTTCPHGDDRRQGNRAHGPPETTHALEGYHRDEQPALAAPGVVA